jgi:type IV pilus assembly protein PilW
MNSLANQSAALQRVRCQSGLTMVELMIAMALGLLILLATTSLLLSSKTGYIAEDQMVQLHETGRYTTEVLARAIRQTGYEHMDGERVAIVATAELTANVAGLDAMTLKKTGAGLSSATSSDVVNGSDILAVRFFGDDAGDGNGTILNCAGLAVPAVNAAGGAEQDRGWSIFYVAKDSAGEPELRCKYQTKTGWNADAIARGVESFQVLYGVDVQGDGAPDQFITARDVDALDDRLALNGNNAVERLADLNRKTYWKKVRSIRFSLLVRGSQKARDDALTDEYHLFGPVYSRMHAGSDKGVHIVEQSLPSATRDFIRKVFTQTIQLRNDAAGSNA